MGVTLLYWQGAVAADAIYLTFNIYLSILSVQPLNQGRLRSRLPLQAVKVGRGKKKKKTGYQGSYLVLQISPATVTMI